MKRLLSAILSLFVVIAASAQRSGADPTVQLQKLVQFYRYLAGSYVDEVDSEKLVEDAVVKMLSELDPHSAYIDAEELKSVNESFDGSFSGIGIEFRVMDDTLRVVNTIVGGPAAAVGVLPGDRVIGVNGESIIGIKQAHAPQLLRGKAGTKVDIEVIRHGESKPIGFTIVRGQIPINTVDAAYMLDPRTGYIKVNRFGRTTMTEFRDAMASMPAAERLVLDLRGNGGGLMDQAVEMANYFLPRGSAIVSIEGRAVPSETFSARRDGEFLKGAVAVMIDENSASASEIVSGALQDWDRAVIVGRPSFGKGLVQRQFPLIDGSAVRITIARYHTPTGRVIQRPFENGKKEEYYEDFVERFGKAEIDSAALDTLPKYRTLVKGRTVYGGGGIMPDVTVPIDTTGYTDYWAELNRRGAIAEFVVDYLDDNRAKIERDYPTADGFIERFEVGGEMIEALAAFGEKRGIGRNPEQLAVSRSQISLLVKAMIAQRLWDTTAYFRIVNADSDMLRQAKEALSVK